tara:strand:+ start:125 stop:244 length:120 start_codon:yes stop_codon:yes gene_type:complete
MKGKDELSDRYFEIIRKKIEQDIYDEKQWKQLLKQDKYE